MEDKLLEWADKVERLLTELAQPTAEIILTTAQLSGIGSLVGGFVAMLAIYPMFRATSYALKEAFAIEKERGERWRKEYEIPYFIGGFFGGVAIVVLGLFASFTLLDKWNWIAAFYPEAYIAHQILGL